MAGFPFLSWLFDPAARGDYAFRAVVDEFAVDPKSADVVADGALADRFLVSLSLVHCLKYGPRIDRVHPTASKPSRQSLGASSTPSSRRLSTVSLPPAKNCWMVPLTRSLRRHCFVIMR
jgi:hypothetical protein